MKREKKCSEYCFCLFMRSWNVFRVRILPENKRMLLVDRSHIVNAAEPQQIQSHHKLIHRAFLWNRLLSGNLQLCKNFKYAHLFRHIYYTWLLNCMTWTHVRIHHSIWSRKSSKTYFFLFFPSCTRKRAKELIYFQKKMRTNRIIQWRKESNTYNVYPENWAKMKTNLMRLTCKSCALKINIAKSLGSFVITTIIWLTHFFRHFGTLI